MLGISRGKYLVIIVVIALLLTIALALFLHYLTFPSSKNVVNTTNKLITNVHRCKVLIADGLYDLFPNRTLINYLRSILVNKGCEVTIYLGSNVTIDVFKRLTNYNVIILRLHGGYGYEHGSVVTGLFTGVKWTYRYYPLAKEGYVAKGVPFYARERAYVALLPKFFEEKLVGRFSSDSILIAFGCFTAMNKKLIGAFLDHGLHCYIGWNGTVTIDYLDRVLPTLINKIIELKDPMKAVSYINKHLGPDPKTGNELVVICK